MTDEPSRDMEGSGDRRGAAAARACADWIASRANGARTPRIGIILGSGLGGLAETIVRSVRIPFAEIPGLPRATVAGHSGELTVGTLEARGVAALAGRFHVYEGNDARTAAFPVRVLHALGVRVLIVTNAAGGIRRTILPDDLMLIDDHVNATWRNPLIGSVEPGDERFPDMSEPYDSGLRDIARAVARESAIPLAEGVYGGVLGPSYETPSEVRLLELMGADVVGMSTVPEVIAARSLGMRVLGISCVTNVAAGMSATPLSHEEVLAGSRRVEERLRRLVTGIVAAVD